MPEAAKTSTATPSKPATSPAQQATPTKPKEAPEVTFRRLANRRVAKALNAIRLCENLARYAHTPEQSAKIVSAMREAVQGVEHAFSKGKRDRTNGFSV